MSTSRAVFRPRHLSTDAFELKFGPSLAFRRGRRHISESATIKNLFKSTRKSAEYPTRFHAKGHSKLQKKWCRPPLWSRLVRGRKSTPPGPNPQAGPRHDFWTSTRLTTEPFFDIFVYFLFFGTTFFHSTIGLYNGRGV